MAMEDAILALAKAIDNLAASNGGLSRLDGKVVNTVTPEQAAAVKASTEKKSVPAPNAGVESSSKSAQGTSSPAQAATPSLDPAHVKAKFVELLDLGREHGIALLQEFQVKTFTDLPATKYQQFLDVVEAKIAELQTDGEAETEAAEGDLLG